MYSELEVMRFLVGNRDGCLHPHRAEYSFSRRGDASAEEDQAIRVLARTRRKTETDIEYRRRW